jgi:glutamate/tyrosine decarboxylase-like PLP-dependent enzyme
MGLRDFVLKQLSRLNPRTMAVAEKALRAIPFVDAQIAKQYEGMLTAMERSAKPYRQDFASYSELPATGRPCADIIEEMEALQAREQAPWREGFVSGGVYDGDEEHINFLNRVYAIHSQSNPLHSDLWPSATKFEAEIVAMTARTLGAAPESNICGTVTSGGTESILLAMKSYRDWARDKKDIAAPEIIAPTTAHVAFDKAVQYFDMKLIRIPVDADFRADVQATRRAITRNTAALVGSAPSFPHGVVDPIQELSELARQQGIGFHTDACLGGFFLPWAEKLGYPVPGFDFRVPGVTSMSADTHKYGYAAKGTSVVLYRGKALRRYQYYTATEWPGGLYLSPTLAGSRPGALSAACWAAMVAIGTEGYMEATRRILETAVQIKKGIVEVPEFANPRRPAADHCLHLRYLRHLQGPRLHGPAPLESQRPTEAPGRSPLRDPASYPAGRRQALHRRSQGRRGVHQNVPGRKGRHGTHLWPGSYRSPARHGQRDAEEIYGLVVRSVRG